MAWLFSFWHLARITNRAVIAKLIPHHLVSNWNVWWQKRPRGLTDLLHPFLGFSSHVNTFCMFCHPAANDKEPCRNSGGAHPRTPRSAKRHTETQCEFTTKIWKEKKKKKTWTSTADGVLVRTDETFCSDSPDAGRSCPFSGRLASIFFFLPSRWKTQTSDQFTVALSSYSDHQLFEATRRDIIAAALLAVGDWSTAAACLFKKKLDIWGNVLCSLSCRVLHTHTHTSMCEIWSCTRCLEKLCIRTSFLKV